MPQSSQESEIKNYVHAEVPVDVVQCCFIEWYRFKQCTIKTCKNWTSRTEHRCLGVDRAQPTGNKIISDAELHYYKMHDTGYSTKYISVKRKETTKRVKALLTLYAFIQYIRERHGSRKHVRFISEEIKKVEQQYPFNLRKLPYKNWMLEFLLSNKEFRAFKEHKDGEVKELKLTDLLCVTDVTFKTLNSEVKEILNATNSQGTGIDDWATRSGQVFQRLGFELG